MRGSCGDIRGAGCWVDPRGIPVASPVEVFGEVGGEGVIDCDFLPLGWGGFSVIVILVPWVVSGDGGCGLVRIRGLR